MFSVIFLTLFAFAGKALLKKLLERKRLNNKSILDLSGGDCEVNKNVSPVLYLPTPRESVSEPEVRSAVQSPDNGSEKHVTFETAAARDQKGSVRTIIIGNHEQEIIWDITFTRKLFWSNVRRESFFRRKAERGVPWGMFIFNMQLRQEMHPIKELTIFNSALT